MCTYVPNANIKILQNYIYINHLMFLQIFTSTFGLSLYLYKVVIFIFDNYQTKKNIWSKKGASNLWNVYKQKCIS